MALTVLNLKGGVGKTHAVWLLASVCQELGRRVLLVDADMQTNLTGSFLGEQDRRPGVDALFDPAESLSSDLSRATARSFWPVGLRHGDTCLARFEQSVTGRITITLRAPRSEETDMPMRLSVKSSDASKASLRGVASAARTFGARPRSPLEQGSSTLAGAHGGYRRPQRFLR